MAHTTAAMLHSGKGKTPSLADFLPKWGRKRRQSAADMLSVFKALASAREKD